MELRVRSVEVVLPDAPSKGGCLRGPLIGEWNRGLQSRRPVGPRAKRNCLAIDFRGDIRGLAVAHLMPEMRHRVVVRKGLSLR